MNLGNPRFRHLLPRVGTTLIGGAGTTFGLTALTLAAGYGLQLVLARWMGPSGYGTYTYVLAWAGTASLLLSLGWPQALIRFVPAYRAAQDGSHLRGLVRRGLGAPILGSMAVALVAAAALWLMRTPANADVVRLALLGVLLTPLLLTMRGLSEALRAFERFTAAYAPPLAQRLLILGGAGLLWASGAPITSTTLLLVVAGSLLCLIAPLAALVHRQVQAAAGGAPAAYETRRWWRVGLPLLAASVLYQINTKADVLMLGLLADTTAVGFYNVGARTAALVSLPLAAIAAVATPAIAAWRPGSGQADLQTLVADTGPWFFWPALGIALAFFVLAEPILRLFGAEFVGGLWALRLLALAHVVEAATGLSIPLLEYAGHHDDSVRVHGWCALLNVLANGVAIPLFGVAGAAAATLLSATVRHGWMHALARRRLGVTASPLARRPS